MPEKCEKSAMDNRQKPEGYWTRQHVDNALMGISDLERTLDVLMEMELPSSAMRLIAQSQKALRVIKVEAMNAQFNLRK